IGLCFPFKNILPNDLDMDKFARIQALCNNYKAALLLSEKLIQDINLENLSMSRSLGSIFLKGKQSPINIHAVLT
ncbi:MAG: hypothetical protein AAFQ94_22135, partial [Bacteroidota bacterium]